MKKLLLTTILISILLLVGCSKNIRTDISSLTCHVLNDKMSSNMKYLSKPQTDVEEIQKIVDELWILSRDAILLGCKCTD